jgi:hypothetical protein
MRCSARLHVSEAGGELRSPNIVLARLATSEEACQSLPSRLGLVKTHLDTPLSTLAVPPSYFLSSSSALTPVDAVASVRSSNGELGAG